jgi:hypothetical protein
MRFLGGKRRLKNDGRDNGYEISRLRFLGGVEENGQWQVLGGQDNIAVGEADFSAALVTMRP